MAAHLPTANDVIALVKKRIRKLGLAAAFKTYGRILLYSGPRSSITKKLRGSKKVANHTRAADQASRTSAVLIDSTNIGRFLSNYKKVGVYTYFEKLYGAVVGPEHANKVMAYTSQQFMKAAFGHAATVVCGADTQKIFYQVEMPVLVKNRRIKTANDHATQLFKDFYAIDSYEAFRLFCITELLQARRHAQKEKTKAAWDDYHDRRRIFMLERQEAKASAPAMTAAALADLKRRKRMVLATYKSAKIIAFRPAKRSAPIARLRTGRKIAGHRLH